MAKFSIVRKGYSVDEVDGFIAKLLELTEAKLSEQAKRINELKEELRVVREEKNELKAKEGSVSLALSEAVKKADELEEAGEKRYRAELGRIEHFRKRFSDYVDKMKKEDALSMDVQEYQSFLLELEEELSAVMESDLNVEREVLPIPPKEEKEEDVVEFTNGFDLQEALTPKETLEEICKELGLL